jgi:nucleolar protein 15
MAPDKKEKKRKAAPAPTDPPTKKSKKVEQPSEAPAKSILKKKDSKKPTEANGESNAKASGESTRKKASSRKRASDFLSDEDESDGEPAKKQTKEAAGKKKSKKVEVAEQVSEAEEENADDEVDDQTADLIKGFESSGDEEDPSDDEGLESGKPVPRIPDSKKAKRKIQKKLKANGEPESPGAVYVGRIPHGFYEHQMRAYFSQFGDITRLRLSRNRVTGSSKHYAFIEFASATVAKIAAETMNNYLMYGHILKCKYIPQEQQHPELWKGANRRYKPVPWAKIDKQRLDRGKTRDKWTKSIEAEEKRRIAKAEKLKALGYDLELPTLKGVSEVPVQETPAAIEADSDAAAAPKEIEPPAAAAAADEAEKTPKKPVKAKEEEATPASKAANTEKTTPSSAKSEGKKTKKSPGKVKKAKA